MYREDVVQEAVAQDKKENKNYDLLKDKIFHVYQHDEEFNKNFSPEALERVTKFFQGQDLSDEDVKDFEYYDEYTNVVTVLFDFIATER